MAVKKPDGLSAAVIRRLPPIEGCDTPLLKCLWALKAAKLSSSYPQFITADTISEILLMADANLTPLRAQRALARAGDAVAKRGKGHETGFRIVGPGETFLDKGAGNNGQLTLYVTGTAPWSDRRLVIKEALKKVTGDVRILDKYFGMESLDFLLDFQKNRRIQFLTSHPTKNLGQLQREVARFKKEFPKSEFKAYPSPHELHDRYVLFDREVWFVGHGIKNLGEKESFVVILQDPFGKDIRNTLVESFDDRWANSPDF
jgi:hypothetical protein